MYFGKHYAYLGCPKTDPRGNPQAVYFARKFMYQNLYTDKKPERPASSKRQEKS